MMQCRSCGIALQPRAVFCSNCGTPAQAALTPPPVVIKSAGNAPGGAPAPIPAAAQQLYAALPQHQPGLPQYPAFQGAPSPPYSPVQPLARPVPPPPPLLPQQRNLAQGPHLAHPVEHPAESEHEKTGTPDAHEEHEENANERLILFSDGVIAFALTLSAISIKIPTDSAALNQQSFSIGVKYLTYIVSFIIVALSWNEHHRMFHHIKRNSMPMVILNFVYLASIVLVPVGVFFIQVVDVNNGNNLIVSIILFLGTQFVAGIALLVLWRYATSHHRLVDPQIDPRLVTYMTLRLLFYPGLIIVLLIATVFPPAGLVGLLVLIGGLFLRRRYRRGLNTSKGSDDVGRILLFSDAVIGIAITILAAQIEFPSFVGNAPTEEVQRVITESLPLLLSYAIGFVVLGAYWLFHYRMFRYINRHNPWLIALNFCFLLCIVLMFAPINYYAAYQSQDSTASFLFSLYQVITALILVLLWRYASRKRRLLDHNITDAQARRFGARIISNLVILFILTLITLFFPIAPLVYLFLYVVAIGLALLIVHVRKPRAQAQQIQVGTSR